MPREDRDRGRLSISTTITNRLVDNLEKMQVD